MAVLLSGGFRFQSVSLQFQPADKILTAGSYPRRLPVTGHQLPCKCLKMSEQRRTRAMAPLQAATQQQAELGELAVTGSASRAYYGKESEQLVKKSWEVLKKDAQRNGINFFRRVFEIAPGAESMYSFLRDSTVPFEENPGVKSHARYVFLMTGEAATQLGEKGTYQVLDSKLHKLAATHINAGVTDTQFEIVKEAILYAIEMGVPELWSPELKSAWGDAYDMIAEAVKGEMQAQRQNIIAATIAAQ